MKKKITKAEKKQVKISKADMDFYHSERGKVIRMMMFIKSYHD